MADPSTARIIVSHSQQMEVLHRLTLLPQFRATPYDVAAQRDIGVFIIKYEIIIFKNRLKINDVYRLLTLGLLKMLEYKRWM